MSKSAAVVQPALVVDEPRAVVEAADTPTPDVWLAMFERLAVTPEADIAKLEKLMDLHQRVQADKARAAFDAAFAAMQAELPEIDERGRIVVKGEFRSSYAKFEDIQKAIKPILARHGFGLRFKNERMDDGRRLRVVGILAHKDGHRETDEFIADPDDSGAKNAIQMNGSTRSYGQRYTSISLLNLSSREVRDDDGASSQAPPAPDGFEAWWAAMQAEASAGMAALSAAWNKSAGTFKNYTTKHRLADWNALKAEAAKGGASA